MEVQKLKSNDICITCSNPDEVQKPQQVQWDRAYHGLKIRKAKYGIVIHGLSTEDLNPTNVQASELTKLEQQNKGQEIKITEVRPLRRKPATTNIAPRHSSIIVFINDPDTADKCIKLRFYINHRHYAAEKYTPQLQITQCFKCQRYGYHASKCKNDHRCVKCSENHPTPECNNTNIKCAECGGNHPAYHPECPSRIEVSKALVGRRQNSSV
jgi:hypothetical protein